VFTDILPQKNVRPATAGVFQHSHVRWCHCSLLVFKNYNPLPTFFHIQNILLGYVWSF